MRRKQNWSVLLAIYLEESRGTKFIWGVNDCALFAADWVKIATGEDLAAPFRGHYSTERGAKKALLQYGNENLLNTLNDLLEAINPAFATQGDVVLLDTILGQALGVVGTCGRHVYFRDLDGLSMRPISESCAAWRIP